jgi:hypothetical protein
MAGVTIKKGDRLPVLARQFTLDGGAIDLTGSTVIFDMWNASTGAQVITAGAATITGAATGDVEYAWTSADATLVAGQYLGAFTASFSGRTMTAPNNGMITIEIYADTASDWSYTGNPSARPIDMVRFLIGDTDSTNAQLNDHEITALLSQGSNDANRAAVYACRSLATKYASKADYSRSVGGLSISTQYGATADRYLKLAATLSAQGDEQDPPIPTVSADALGSFHFSVDMDKFR